MAIYGVATAATGGTFGVRGQSVSTSGTGVFGFSTAPTGLTYGILGSTLSTAGTGLSGQATAVTGNTIGIRAVTQSPTSTAAFFDNLGGGKLISARTTGYVERFSVDGSGNLAAGGTVTGTRMISTIATGTAPLQVSSTTLVPNLNADLLDGLHAASFATLGRNSFLDDQIIAGNLSLTGSINGALRIENSNVIGGDPSNHVTSGVTGAVIGGGTGGNRVTDNFGVVGGGEGNLAGNEDGDNQNSSHNSVGGGLFNGATGGAATVGGGSYNGASSWDATVGGGYGNSASNSYATVGGGYSNTASGADSTVAGGYYNVAQGDMSFAAGSQAKAIHAGTFVWGDSSNAAVSSTGPNQFVVRAKGGAFFSDYLTAAHFIGDGSALTNVNAATATDALALGGVAPSGYATVGSNSFSGTQTISSGNLSLPATTGSGAGVINLGGSPFIHAYGYGNAFIGLNTGNFTTTGPYNTASGYSALYSNTTGGYNTASGDLALAYNTTGNHNVAIGEHSGHYNSTGSSNIFIGVNAGPDSGHPDLNNATAIGAGAVVSQSDSLVLGGTGVNVGIGTATPGQRLTVVGVVESTSGGFKFPDGTTQTTASAGGGVTSFEGRTGAVVSANSDYSFSEISGTVGATQLSGSYSNALTFSNASNSFTGSGAGLTSLSASNLGSGTLPDARLSGSYTGALTLSNASNSFTGSGAGLTSLSATNLSSGTVPSARISGTYSSAVTFSSASNSFTGSGAGLTSLSATNLSSGTVPSARISGTYSSAVTLSNASNSFTGNGAGLTNISADTATSATTAATATNALALNGLASSAYEQVANKNAVSGYAGLDSSSRIAKAQAPSATAYKDASNTFTTGTQDFSGATATLPVKSVLSASTPSSCTANKELLIKTDATAGQQLFICNGSGNGWNLAGDGSSAGGRHQLQQPHRGGRAGHQ